MNCIKKWSNVVGPLPWNQTNEKYVSKSQKLFLQSGLLVTNDGFVTLGPILVRSLRKLEAIVRRKMEEVSAQEILLPTLTNSSLLKISGRLNTLELFKLKEFSSKSYVLGATHEEEVTSLLASVKSLSYKQIPYRLYQISNKFRDEKRVKSGLLRSKEFVMKDLYCFETTPESNEAGYQEVIKKYHEFFEILKIPFVSVDAPPGSIGGLKSTEFHFLNPAGEDKIVFCQKCGHIENGATNHCHKCFSVELEIKNGIEVGHAFNLGTTFSKPFFAAFQNQNKKSELLHMSCFGLGLTRILAASAEVLSSERDIKWPFAIAPYLVCVIPPKTGSKEESSARNIPEQIYKNLIEKFCDDVVYFDVNNSTIGKRLSMVKQIGFPIAAVIGKNIKDEQPLVEVHDLYSNTVDFVQVPDVNSFISSKLLQYIDKNNF